MGSTYVALPDGRQVDITGASPDQLAAMRQKLSALQKPAEPATPPTTDAQIKAYTDSVTPQGGFVPRMVAGTKAGAKAMIPSLEQKPDTFHMVTAGMGPLPELARGAYQGYEASRKQGQGVLQSIGAGLGSVAGLDVPGIEKRSAKGDVAGVIGEGIPAVVATIMGGEAHKIPGAISDLRETVRTGKQLPELVTDRISAAQTQAQDLIKQGDQAYAAKVGEKTSAIAAADQANPLPRGQELLAQPIKDVLLRESGAQQPTVNMPNVARASKLLDDYVAEGPMSFERLKELRTKIGDLTYDRNIPKAERQILDAVYKQATDMMANRASQLGQTENFTNYNNEYEKLSNFREHILPELMGPEASRFPDKFWQTLTNPKDAATLKMLANYEKASPGVGANISKAAEQVKPLNDYISRQASGTGEAFTGRLKGMMRHPIAASIGATMGLGPGKLVGMPWVGEMLGASKGASFGDRLAATRAMREGPSFSAGADINRTVGRGVITPEPSPLKQGKMNLPPEMNPPVEVEAPPKLHPGKIGEGTSAVNLVGEEKPRTNAAQEEQSHSHEIERLTKILMNPAATPEELDYAIKAIEASEQLRKEVPKMIQSGKLK